jgi:hypothetical protein
MVLLGMHRISGLPDNPAFFDIRFQAGYRIWFAGFPAGDWILKMPRYPAEYPAD